MRDYVDPMSFSVFTLAGCSMPGTGYRSGLGRMAEPPARSAAAGFEPQPLQDSATPVARNPPLSPSDGRSLA